VTTTSPRDALADLLELAREWSGASDETRDRALQSACAFAAQALAERPDRDRILEWRDPLPADSVALLERLKRDARAKR
jgi:hypothetical protein